MTAKEKAQELVDKMRVFQEEYSTDGWELAKECAIVCCDEIIFALHKDMSEMFDKDYADANIDTQSRCWNEVKKEIKNL